LRRAFSLLELITVIIIISIATGIAAVSFRHAGQRDPVDEVLESLEATFSAAQSRAVLGGVAIRVSMNKDEAGAAAFTISSIGGSASRQGEMLRTGEDTRPLPPSCNASFQDEGDFLFLPSGEARGPTLTVSAGERSAKITLDRLTGRMIVEEQP
jgi:prepilin-type N-terminal cleavage/methylation domain-containing protein